MKAETFIRPVNNHQLWTSKFYSLLKRTEVRFLLSSIQIPKSFFSVENDFEYCKYTTRKSKLQDKETKKTDESRNSHPPSNVSLKALWN